MSHASYLFGDNLGVMQNVMIKDSLLKKKHVAISYHKCHEAVATGIIQLIKIDGKNNYANVLMKAQTAKTFAHLVGGVMYE